MGTIEDAVDRLTNANLEFLQADQKYKTASAARTQALNRVNEAQKAVDTEIAKLREKSPRDSDWRSTTRH